MSKSHGMMRLICDGLGIDIGVSLSLLYMSFISRSLAQTSFIEIREDINTFLSSS